ncbi:hypothetical protein BpHYR1_009436 [Brachionus plicatilis]|uniref:Uncharacterized protein n=1 Tax=Brachionus plicatilis TaxID=10195 RepID=A0A3M7QQE5_BRAPC|nr:hypothetical protein BpHYR1_009436 [Brachionus plicatilis]
MLSQALPNELVAPKSYMPPRVKSAYLKLVGNPSGLPDPNSSYIFKNTNSFDGSIVHEIVSARNANERIKELEQTNLNLKRMLDLVVSDPTSSTERIKTSNTRLLVNRSAAQNPLGPPVLRQGRIGSSWRHIKQTNNYGNSNLLFIDGTVRINDSARFPPKIYGYPPRANDQNADLVGLTTQSLNDLSFAGNERVRNRTSNLSAYPNQFHDRAKQGFEYWTKDKREPENNKTKATRISIGHPYFKSGY